jgi:hypothetical protein
VYICLVVLLGGKGDKVSTPFINAFQKKKAWNLPKSSTNLGDSKPVFFPPQNVAISKLFFFFSLLEMWRFSFFFRKFSKTLASPGGLFGGFSPQKIIIIIIKLLCAFVCVSLGNKAVAKI